MMRKFIIDILLTGAVVCACSVLAAAQGAVSYRFLEVVDYKNKPVVGATVKVNASCEGGALQTNEKGQLPKGLPIGFGDCQTENFSVSKAGYYPFEDHFGMTVYTAAREPLRLELLVIPKTAAERAAIGNEQLKRELFTAAIRPDAATVRKLLKEGLSPNLTTNDLRGLPLEKNTPVVYFAAVSGDAETLDLFLAAGADVRKSPAILYRFLSSHYSEREYYRRTGKAVKPETAEQLTAFEDSAGRLIKAGADLQFVDQFGSNILMIAAEGAFPRTLKTLLDKGLPVDGKDNSGRTALMRLIAGSQTSKTRLDAARVLLDGGADPNVFSNNGYYYEQKCQTALIYAVFNADLEMVNLLIAHKANVNAACANGDTALKYAKDGQSKGYKDFRGIIKALEAAGAK